MVETSILNSLVYNKDYTTQVLPYLKPEYFEQQHNLVLFNIIKDYVLKYGVSPTKEALSIEVNALKIGEMLHKDTLEEVNRLVDQQTNTKHLLDITEKWCKDRALYLAIYQAIDIIQGEVKENTVHSIPEILKDALAVSFDSNIGHDYFEQAAAQYDYYNDVESKTPFSIDTLNRITKGGIPAKTLNVFMLPINAGKTTCLIDQAAHWLELGKNVMYFTLEVSENVIRERLDVRLLNIPFSDLRSVTKEQYIKRVDKIKHLTKASLIIKEFPSGAVGSSHFRHIIEEAKLKKEFVPDVIIVDYLTICASSRLPQSARANSNLYFTTVAQELRGLAFEYNCPVWTAEQFTRGAQDNKEVTMSDVGLSIGIAQVSDFMLAFMPSEELKGTNTVWGKQLKNRYGNKEKETSFMMGLDNDMQRLFDPDGEVATPIQNNSNKATPKKSNIIFD